MSSAPDFQRQKSTDSTNSNSSNSGTGGIGNKPEDKLSGAKWSSSEMEKIKKIAPIIRTISNMELMQNVQQQKK
jgi:hypothetical protein